MGRVEDKVALITGAGMGLGGAAALLYENVKALKCHPIGFLGEPRDIAYMILYFASDESRFVTGSEMIVNGGNLMV
jgi:NAD(P)-dependent dehydrogenase (short-subunit alcohol dehydrogenase family)